MKDKPTPYSTLREAVETVVDMHHPAEGNLDGPVCVECGNPYICETQLILGAALGECDELDPTE